MNASHAQHDSKSKAPIVLLGVFVMVVFGIASGFFFNSMRAEATPVLPESTVQKSSFALDTSKVTGWFAGDNNWQDDDSNGTATAGAQLLSMTIAQGTKEKPTGTCFAMYFYHAGTVDEASALEKVKAMAVTGETDVTIGETGTQDMFMATSEGVKEYQLHQYAYTGAASATMTKGVQFAFVPLKNGYVEIRSYCEEASQLPNTLDAISAVSFKL